MKKTLFTFFLFGISFMIYSQDDSTSVYSKLKTKKFYAVSTSSSSDGKETVYKVNGKISSKSEYMKYQKKWKNMEDCCPCILKTYDIDNTLLYESVSCTDCRVGWYKEYYSDGSLKIKGRYKENPTNNWEDIYNRGYCSIRHGNWEYYDRKGKLKYIEIWENDTFVKQSPESNKPELWKAELLLGEVNVQHYQTINIQDFNKLKILIHYKNSKEYTDLKLKLTFHPVGSKKITKEINLEDLENYDLNEVFKEFKNPKVKNTSVRINLIDDTKVIYKFLIIIE